MSKTRSIRGFCLVLKKCRITIAGSDIAVYIIFEECKLRSQISDLEEFSSSRPRGSNGHRNKVENYCRLFRIGETRIEQAWL